MELYTNASLVRGPFIQMPDPGNAAAVVWNTAALVDSVVDYGLDLTYGSGTISNGTPKREHTIHLAGLTPGTTYYYRVRGNGEILSEGNAFRTRPTADQNFRFVVIGDHGQGTPQMYTIANLINARSDFDAIMTVGDNIYGLLPCNLDGAPGWYDPYWFQLYEPTMKRVSTFPALGNHDWDTAQGQYMVDYFRLPTNGPTEAIGKNYSFEFGNMHVIVIDTEPFDENRPETNAISQWITADLATATQQWKVALIHRPAFTSRSNSHNDNSRVKTHIIPRLKAGGVQLVFQGHNHWYERINAIDGIQYITTAGAGAGLYDVVERKEYSARWAKEFSYTMVDVQGGRMFIQQINESGSVIDEHTIVIDHPFAIDGLLDNPAWSRASNGMNLYAAIRENFLYVATQDAGEGSDHFIYVADQLTTQRPANWAKSGTIMQWGAFLADENDGAFQAWYGASSGAPLNDPTRYLSMTSGTNNNAPVGNGVLEGTMHLAGHFGAFPSNLYLAVGAFGTADGGALTVQVPAGNNDGNIDAAEFLALNPRDIALDLPVANAGNPQSVEAGMWAVLDGSGSFSPSALPLTWHWEQTAGPAVVTTNLDLSLAAFVITSNVNANTDITFSLRVHDGRFFSDAQPVTVTLFPMVDSDGDGLSDQEELTGFNNVLTRPNPNGVTTDPNNPDTDGDGVSDGDEALAGTNPNDPTSRFIILGAQTVTPDGFVIDFSSVSGRLYLIEYNHVLSVTGWQEFAQIWATSAVARVNDPGAASITQRYYRIGVEAE
ncbi:MAG TPA: metallophosphoesterase [Kiritimatiellia bacterium]|nr:metallophosphoesterase [Kiritimatiellia bacterium]HMO99879.1 metallophosphoesterase [Kiritimatiellia bacterium]HMP96750.1 metallophosphoesterase [Kiritimatiellia bacterium]